MGETFKKISDALCSRPVRKVLFLSSIAISIFCLVSIFFIPSREDESIKKQIAELEKKSIELEKAQLTYDSAIGSQNAYVHELEQKIANVKEKTTVIKEYYTTIKERVNDYDYNQIDSFFKQRYNY